MNHALIPPYDPKQSGSVRTPTIYVKESLKWEYKQIVRNFEKENPLDEAELKTLGEEGWEMTGVIQQPPLAYFYFKRPIEK